jgi:hypothetical protein
MTDLNLGLPTAWVVKCKKCGCTINCRAIDPQVAYLEPDKAEPPPQDTVLVTCSCCWAAYRYSPAEVFKGPAGPSSEELTDIVLKLRERVDMSPQQRYRLVGIGLSNFREAERTVAQPALFE